MIDFWISTTIISSVFALAFAFAWSRAMKGWKRTIDSYDAYYREKEGSGK